MSEKAQAAAAASTTESVVEKSLLDQIVEEGRLARDPESRESGKAMVKEFVSQFLDGAMTLSRDSEAMINARIAQIDHLISLQLNEVMHHPDFQMYMFKPASVVYNGLRGVAGWGCSSIGKLQT
jgi:type VI secretion system protein ImpC